MASTGVDADPLAASDLLVVIVSVDCVVSAITKLESQLEAI